MALYINYNGKILPDDSRIVGADNRGLRYGDGLFETMKFENGQIRLFDRHMERLFKGLGLLKFDVPVHFSKELLQESILQLCDKNKAQQAQRIRLNVFRGSGGLYDPEDLRPNYVIEALPIPEHLLRLNENGLVIDIYPDAYKSCDTLSNSKTNNYLPYIMAALHAKEQKLNDCLVLNQHGRICDATIANIFWIKNDVIHTPALTEGCVAGVMRSFLIERLLDAGYGILEATLDDAELEKADEVFLTNAVHGIRWVRQFRNTDYSNQLTQKIYKELL